MNRITFALGALLGPVLVWPAFGAVLQAEPQAPVWLELSAEDEESPWKHVQGIVWETGEDAFQARIGEVWEHDRARWMVRGTALGWARLEALPEEGAPFALVARSEGGGVRLQWQGPEEEEYRLWRRSLRRGAQAVSLGSARGNSFLVEDRVEELMCYFVQGVASGGASSTLLHPTPEIESTGQLPGLLLDAGLEVDLALGREVPQGGHLRVRYVGDSSAYVEPGEGVHLAAAEAGSWFAQELVEGVYDRRPMSLREGQEVYASLPEGVFVRLRLVKRPDGMGLVTELGPQGGREIPRIPSAGRMEWTDGRGQLRIDGLAKASQAADYVLVVEREDGYGSERWEAWRELPGGGGQVEVGELSELLQRLRVRYARTDDRHRTLASPAWNVLSIDPRDRSSREATYQRALGALQAEPYRERRFGHGLLEAMGPLVVPQLRETLAEDPESSLAGEISQALSEIDGGQAEGLAALLKRQARELRVDLEAPAGWLDPDPIQRGAALLASRRDGARSAEEAARQEAWLQVLAAADPDAGVSTLARMALVRPEAGRRLPDGSLAVLLPPDKRPVPGALPGLFGNPQAAAAHLLESADPFHPRAAWVELIVADRLARSARQDGPARELERLNDALGLLSHYRSLEDAILVDAATALVRQPSSSLVAWRELAARRLSWPGAEGAEELRERIELPEASFAALADTLEELADNGLEYVDVVLPSGLYSPPAGGRSTWLELDVPGLRLIGQGEVIIEAGARVLDVHDVVLENVTFDNRRGAGLYLAHGSASLVGATLSGSDSSVTVIDGWLEGTDVELSPSQHSRGGAFSVKLQDRSTLLLRDSLILAGGMYAAGDAQAYLESSVLVAGERHAMQASRGAEVVLRDVWVRGDAGGLHGMSSGLLVGVLLEVQRDPFGVPATRLDLCPKTVEVLGCDVPADASWLSACPLHK